ncbi:MAG TPA: metallophosphoesterase [Candidatus Glassbacteria bacterium]|nr:metallophosphoesterase [Candidatus Glassbacteria bacterium]
MKLAWVTDPHLNFLSPLSIKEFCNKLNSHPADGVVITGDIAEAPTVAMFLETIATTVHKPIYFVLGNHDFYHGCIDDVRREVIDISNKYDNLHYMTDSKILELTPHTAMVGHEGWYDCRSGNFITSPFVLTDFSLIDEYRYSGGSKEDIYKVSNKIAQQALQHFGYYLKEGLKKYDEIILITHVPPFTRMCMYKGGPSETDALPFFSCASLGDLIVGIKDEFPEKTLTVLAGHTHYAASFHFEKIYGYTGAAEYGDPKVYKTLTINR